MFLDAVRKRKGLHGQESVTDGQRLLIVQPLDRRGRDKGRPLVALDSVGAGAGETIYWCRGREATLAFSSSMVPTEATIVGIVDQVNISGSQFGALPS